MTKRAPGKFARSPRDLYDTPFKAVPPLLPSLGVKSETHPAYGAISSCTDIKTFAEPCSGNGLLIKHLTGFGLECAYQGDLATGQDALKWKPSKHVGQIITNPPWSWSLLKPLIAHFIATGLPVWLLLDADLMHNVRMKPFMINCFKVVSVGRLKWIPDSAHQGLDNAAWYGFDRAHTGWSQFVPRMEKAA